VEPALVLRNSLHKDGDSLACRWDTDVLAEQLHMASLYYGDCLIAPEMNKDNGLVEILKIKGANIYTRTEINRRTDEPTQYLGWKTDASNRGMIVDKFAAAIRDSGTRQRNRGFDVGCEWTVAEMRSLVINAAGRAEAASKKHDDQVLMLCIGYNLLDLATPYHARPRGSWTPPEIRQYERMNTGRGRGEFAE
jgi:hypothetical protein